MPDILKRFSAYKNTLTRHGAIALIGAGMVALGIDASYFFDVPFLQILCKTAGGIAWLATLYTYKTGWDVMKPRLKGLDEQDSRHCIVIKRRKDAVIKNAVLYGLVSGVACIFAGKIIYDLAPPIYYSAKEVLPRGHAIEANNQLDDLCLAPASREVLLGGKPTTIIVEGQVTEHKVLRDNTITHSANIRFQYLQTGIFAKNGQEKKDFGHATITRQGPYDPKAAKEGRGCIPLDKFNFEN